MKCKDFHIFPCNKSVSMWLVLRKSELFNKENNGVLIQKEKNDKIQIYQSNNSEQQGNYNQALKACTENVNSQRKLYGGRQIIHLTMPIIFDGWPFQILLQHGNDRLFLFLLMVGEGGKLCSVGFTEKFHSIKNCSLEFNKVAHVIPKFHLCEVVCARVSQISDTRK